MKSDKGDMRREKGNKERMRRKLFDCVGVSVRMMREDFEDFSVRSYIQTAVKLSDHGSQVMLL